MKLKIWIGLEYHCEIIGRSQECYSQIDIRRVSFRWRCGESMLIISKFEQGNDIIKFMFYKKATLLLSGTYTVVVMVGG